MTIPRNSRRLLILLRLPHDKKGTGGRLSYLQKTSSALSPTGVDPNSSAVNHVKLLVFMDAKNVFFWWVGDAEDAR